jgi:uncharacterized protein (TIGR03437 family)
MYRARLLLALLLCGMARGAAPAYSAANVVHASNFAPGPFAPNSVLSIFGSDLARSAQGLMRDDIRGGLLPVELNFTRVLVDNIPAPLFYVSGNQINFLVPSKQLTGNVQVQVVRQGLAGPAITIPVVDAAPALFSQPNGFAIATHADNSLVDMESPARGGEIIVLYATGLGRAVKNPANGELPPYLSEIVNLATLKLTLGGVSLDPSRIKYAGLTPGSAGLYQINFEVPTGVEADPEIRVSIGSISTPLGLKLAVK